MMRILTTLIALSFLAPAAFADVAKLKGQAQFDSDAPVEKIKGTADGLAELNITGDDLSTITGKIAFDVKSMKTGNDMRDSHLRGAEWLEADKYPQIVFTVKSVKPKGGEMVSVTGNFSLHGVDKEMTTDAEVKVVKKGERRLIQIKTKFTVALAEFNVKGKAGVVGKKVGKEIAVKVRLRGAIK